MSREKALAKVKENRKKHNDEYLDSLRGYKVRLEEFLQKQMKRLDASPPGDAFHISHAPEMPNNQLGTYDRYIKMLEWEESPNISLAQNEFENIIMDQWHWKASWEQTKALYNG